MALNNNPFLGRDNPYLTQKIDQAQGDLVRNYNLTAQPAFNSAMVNSGSFGNAGVQQMNENAQKNLQSELGDISTNMRGQDYRDQQSMFQWDQGFDRSLYNDAYSQNMNNLTTGIGLLGTMAGYNANDLTNANNIQNTPLNYLQQFSQIASGIGGMGSTSTGTQSQQGGGSNPLMSALGGAQLGNSWANGWGGGGNSTNPFYTGSGNSGSNGGFNWYTGNSGTAD